METQRPSHQPTATPRSALRAGLGWVFAGLWLALGAGCETAPTTITQDFISTGIFKHSQHLSDAKVLEENGGKALGCQDCHFIDAQKQYEAQRPGSQDHAPCDRCHQEEFYQQPSDFCQVCHTSVDPLKAQSSPLEPYPRRAVAAELVSAFNHKVHLAGERVKKDGKGLNCQDCHAVSGPGEAYASFPKHPVCAKCHGEVVSPTMKDCSGCHAANGPGKERRFIKNDIRFTHGKHQTDAKGNEIACETCHYAIKQSDAASEINLPLMKDCAKCHEDKNKTPDSVRIAQCGVCHTDDINSKGLPGSHTASLPAAKAGDSWASLWEVEELDVLRELQARAQSQELEAGGPLLEPTSFAELLDGGSAMVADISGVVVVQRDMPTGTRPEDHTPIFRVQHNEAASSPDAKCNYCHTGLSGSPRDSCRDCHSTWKPRNHTARWRGVEHGRESALDQQRCATCHETDFCTECHNVPPPNHSPRSTFLRSHGRVARFNARACLTCHTFETTCIDCHVITIKPIQDGPTQ